MTELNNIIKEKNLILIEDTCESLGSMYKNKFLGTFGKFGTYSFFMSHQITSGEGGMITCNNYEDYKIIYTMRAHGWDRGMFKKNNKNFNFVNSGFNLRPLEISAAMGLSQFKRLNLMNKTRSENREKIISSVEKSKKWKQQLTFLEPIKNLKASWFGLPILIGRRFIKSKKKYLKYLNKHGIETRPIIGGNFLNQPSIKLYKMNEKNKLFINSQKIEDRGFFIGLHTHPIGNSELNTLTEKLLNIL